MMSLQTGDSDEEEAAPDWGPTLNLRASPRAWSSSFAPTYDLQGATSSEQEAKLVVLKEGPGTGPATEASERSPEERSVVRETTQQRERARASSEPPRQAEEEPAEGRKESRAPSADPPARGRRKIVFGSSKLLLLASVAQADNANWANLSQALLEANASGAEKAETLERLRQLAEGRRASRQGLEEAARQERARVAQAAEEEEQYRARAHAGAPTPRTSQPRRPETRRADPHQQPPASRYRGGGPCLGRKEETPRSPKGLQSTKLSKPKWEPPRSTALGRNRGTRAKEVRAWTRTSTLLLSGSCASSEGRSSSRKEARSPSGDNQSRRLASARPKLRPEPPGVRPPPWPLRR